MDSSGMVIIPVLRSSNRMCASESCFLILSNASCLKSTPFGKGVMR